MANSEMRVGDDNYSNGFIDCPAGVPGRIDLARPGLAVPRLINGSTHCRGLFPEALPPALCSAWRIPVLRWGHTLDTTLIARLQFELR